LNTKASLANYLPANPIHPETIEMKINRKDQKFNIFELENTA